MPEFREYFLCVFVCVVYGRRGVCGMMCLCALCVDVYGV